MDGGAKARARYRTFTISTRHLTPPSLPSIAPRHRTPHDPHLMPCLSLSLSLFVRVRHLSRSVVAFTRRLGRSELERLFSEWDADGSGQLSKEEFRRGIGQLQLGATPEEVRSATRHIVFSRSAAPTLCCTHALLHPRSVAPTLASPVSYTRAPHTAHRCLRGQLPQNDTALYTPYTHSPLSSLHALA